MGRFETATAREKEMEKSSKLLRCDFYLNLFQTPELLITCITKSVFFLLSEILQRKYTNMDLQTKKSLHIKSQLCV